MPKRIKRERTKGWRMPPNTVYVGRGSKWGNPFRVMGRNEYLYCDASHLRTLLNPWLIFDHDQDITNNPATAEMAVDHYRRWIDGKLAFPARVRPCRFTVADVAELRGKDLACWCKLDCACHADILLEIANA